MSRKRKINVVWRVKNKLWKLIKPLHKPLVGLDPVVSDKYFKSYEDIKYKYKKNKKIKK